MVESSLSRTVKTRIVTVVIIVVGLCGVGAILWDVFTPAPVVSMSIGDIPQIGRCLGKLKTNGEVLVLIPKRAGGDVGTVTGGCSETAFRDFAMHNEFDVRPTARFIAGVFEGVPAAFGPSLEFEDDDPYFQGDFSDCPYGIRAAFSPENQRFVLQWGAPSQH